MCSNFSQFLKRNMENAAPLWQRRLESKSPNIVVLTMPSCVYKVQSKIVNFGIFDFYALFSLCLEINSNSKCNLIGIFCRVFPLLTYLCVNFIHEPSDKAWACYVCVVTGHVRNIVLQFFSCDTTTLAADAFLLPLYSEECCKRRLYSTCRCFVLIADTAFFHLFLI